MSATPVSDDLISTGLSLEDAVSPDFAGSASEFAASDFVSEFDALAVTAGALSACTAMPSRNEDLPPDGVASDVVNEALVDGRALLASAVWVCSRSGAEAAGSPITGLAPSLCPTVDRNSRLATETAGFAATPASAALSAFGAPGASTPALSLRLSLGSLAATGCGRSFCSASRGCENLAGVISPGVMTTRAPILVQFHIFAANAIGMRMQPWEAG